MRCRSSTRCAASLNQAFADLPEAVENILSEDDATDDATIAVASRWLRGRQRTLLAPVAAGTIDQLLAASLKSRRGFLRWLGLSGKTMIIDEAHSFDAYMHGLLLTALTWLGRFGVPVIVMSATLPKRISAEMVGAWCRGAGVEAPDDTCAYPGWLFVGSDGATQTSQIPSEALSLKVRAAEVPHWATTSGTTSAGASGSYPERGLRPHGVQHRGRRSEVGDLPCPVGGRA